MKETKHSLLNTEEEYNKLRKQFVTEEQENNYKYRPEVITRKIHEDVNLRRIYLALVKKNPALISEIAQESMFTKQTCYNQLFKLINLKLVDRVYASKVINGVVKNEEIEKKLERWFENMTDSSRRYYAAKTSYWVITNFGKQFLKKAIDFENEFKEKEHDQTHIDY